MTGETRAARWSAETDVLIIGSGVAGLSTAVRARELGLRVLVVTKADAQAGSTAYAQGGVAVVLPGEHEPGDCCARHVADTRTAGAGLCADWATEQIIAAGPAAVLDLQHRGAKFDRGADGHLARTREGGHGTFRVVHSGGDATGAEVARALLAAARDGGVPILTGHTAVDALRTGSGAIGGLSVLDDAGVPGVLSAAAVVVATGGIGQLYRATTNPSVSTGDGLALALRAGARIADVEFVQFHPTVLYTGSDAVGQRPLITEAVRGEG
ncbi:MAG: FAD-dependent oxidoreductase, partial [Sciscionella sp.]